jgi:hypothetical protein
MSECFTHIDYFIDYLISYIEECIKIPYDNHFFVDKKMIKNSPKVIKKKVNYNSFSFSKNDNIEEDENENDWNIV